MKRPTGWKANPQAMASVSTRVEYSGSLDLGAAVDGDTWLTPRFILEQLGKFDMDPCAAAQNPGWTGCSRNITAEENGLVTPWCGRVFMNPPFSKTAEWIRRHAKYGNGVSLVPASVESQVWRECVWPRAAAIILLHGRTRFCNPDGSNTQGRPLRSIALIAWTPADADVLRGATMAGVFLHSWRMN